MLFSISQLHALKAHNRITEAEVTVAQKSNRTASPENSLSSFSGALFACLQQQGTFLGKQKLSRSAEKVHMMSPE